MSNFKKILFDLDGTLTDSGEGILKTAAFAFETLGYPVPDPVSIRYFVGPPLSESFRKFNIPQDQIETAIQIYRSRYTTIGKFENVVYPGIVSLLDRLTQEGFELYVATSKPEKTSLEILDHFQLSGYFKKIAGASGDHSRETKDAVLSYLLESIGHSDDILMVGDTRFDVIGASKLNIPCAGVAWGYGSVADLKENGAIMIAETPEELYHFLVD